NSYAGSRWWGEPTTSSTRRVISSSASSFASMMTISRDCSPLRVGSDESCERARPRDRLCAPRLQLHLSCAARSDALCALAHPDHVWHARSRASLRLPAGFPVGGGALASANRRGGDGNRL